MPDVAPKPNPRTGEPRPPRAPVQTEAPSSDKNQSGKAEYPDAPDGRGTVLEWYQGKATNSAISGVMMSAILVAFLCLRDWGVGWIATWWLWLFVIWPPFVFYLYGRKHGDWFAVKGGHVDTYNLTKAKVVGASGGLAWDLELKDKKGTELSINLREIQANRDLWDLVYNGIAHSVQRGAKTNPRALDKLKLR